MYTHYTYLGRWCCAFHSSITQHDYWLPLKLWKKNDFLRYCVFFCFCFCVCVCVCGGGGGGWDIQYCNKNRVWNIEFLKYMHTVIIAFAIYSYNSSPRPPRFWMPPPPSLKILDPLLRTPLKINKSLCISVRKTLVYWKQYITVEIAPYWTLFNVNCPLREEMSLVCMYIYIYIWR